MLNYTSFGCTFGLYTLDNLPGENSNNRRIFCLCSMEFLYSTILVTIQVSCPDPSKGTRWGIASGGEGGVTSSVRAFYYPSDRYPNMLSTPSIDTQGQKNHMAL